MRSLPVAAALWAVFLLSSCATQPHKLTPHYTAPSADPVRESITGAQASVDRAVKIVSTLKADKPSIDQLTYELTVAQAALKTAGAQIDKLQKQIDEVTEAGNRAIDERNTFAIQNDQLKESVSAEKAHAHYYKRILCGAIAAIAALLTLYLVLHLKVPMIIPPPYSAYIRIAKLAAPALVFGAVFSACWLRL